MLRRILSLAVFVGLLTTPLTVAAQTATPVKPSPPTQPATGPGGAEYLFNEVTAVHHGPEPNGSVDPDGYWLFEPAAPLENIRVGALPLILFFHGYYGTDPSHYREWIDHLVRRGAVVLYPDYQPLEEALLTECPQVCSEDVLPTLPHALAAIRAGLAELAAGEHVPVDLTKVAATGHSWGGMLSAKYAAIAEAEGLPPPAAIMPAMPGCDCFFASEVGTVPATTNVIMLVGRQDVMVGEQFARQMWRGMSAVPLERRDFVRLTVDNHGSPSLVADHGTPATDGVWGPLDALDWYGTWKFFDALLACSFDDAGCETALGNTPEQRFMGVWSDGAPVVEAEITDDP